MPDKSSQSRHPQCIFAQSGGWHDVTDQRSNLHCLGNIHRDWIREFVLGDGGALPLTEDELEIWAITPTSQGLIRVVADVDAAPVPVRPRHTGAIRPTISVLVLPIAIPPAVWVVARTDIRDLGCNGSMRAFKADGLTARSRPMFLFPARRIAADVKLISVGILRL